MNKCALIDIGSNSIRYAEEECGRLPQKEIFTTRLGSGLMETGRLADETMANSLEVIGGLAERAKEGGFVLRAYATSAVRDAVNGRDFSALIEEKYACPVEILTGEQEARYAFCGAAGSGYDAMLDIGGASMQVVTAERGVSFRAGCVRCSDIARAAVGASSPDDRPYAQREAVREYLRRIFDLPRMDIGRLVGVGGTITTLAALRTGLPEFNAEAVNAVTLTQTDTAILIASLIKTGERRREHPLLTRRHDVILYGAYILQFALEALKVRELGVSCSDGMEGYLMVLKEREA